MFILHLQQVTNITSPKRLSLGLRTTFSTEQISRFPILLCRKLLDIVIHWVDERVRQSDNAYLFDETDPKSLVN